jgi:hypothetical protein
MKAPLLTLFSCLLFFSALQAQRRPVPVFDTRHKNIYVEFLGSNLVTGVNFDIRLQRNRLDGPGLRAGIGGLNVTVADDVNYYDLGVVTMPLEFNHLVGKRRSKFEAGIGILPIYASLEGTGEATNHRYVNGTGFGLAGGFINLGYRYQPLRNGLMFRFTWNPMVLRDSGFNSGWVSFGLGFGFK